MKDDLKHELPEELAEKLSVKKQEKISGGNYEESFRMALKLYGCGYPSVFASEATVENGYINIIDEEKMKAFFAEKGYRFVRGKTDEEQDIYWKDGLPYGSDYILDLIENGKF